MITNFVSIDFETANAKYPCSIGLVEFENGVIVNKYYSLINPEIEKFNFFAQRIHGISKDDILNEKTFPQVWSEIKSFFDDKIIVAHNMPFDFSVLKFMLETYKLETPLFKTFCTLEISRQYLEVENYKLNSIAKHLNIEQINYHNSLDDAIVCGNVFLKLLQRGISIENIKDTTLNTSPKKAKGYFNYNKWKQDKINNSRVRDEVLFEKLLNKKTENLQGKTFVVSGVFEKVSRNELKKMIEDNGGKVSGSISTKTSYVVAGANMGPSKKEKAESLGVPIISEEEFLGMV